jgi:hypothetical protein
MKMIVFFSGNKIPEIPHNISFVSPKVLDSGVEFILINDDINVAIQRNIEDRIKNGYTAVVFNAVEEIKIEPQIVKKSLI